LSTSLLNSLLAVRTHFTTGQSVITPDDLPAIVERSGCPDFVICDTMSISALVEVSKKRKETFRPRFGVSLRIVDDLSDRENKKQREVFPKVYPLDWGSMQALFRLLSKSWDADHFYYVPRLSFLELKELLLAGNFVVTTGDFKPIFEHPDHESMLREIMSLVPGDRFFVELSPVPTGYHDRINTLATKFLAGANCLSLVTYPVFYDGDTKHEQFVINMAMQSRATKRRPTMINEPAHKDYQPISPAKLKEYVKASVLRTDALSGIATFSFWKQGLINQAKFLEALTYVWEKQKISLPSLSANPDEELKRLCVEGIRKRQSHGSFGHKIDSVALKDAYLPRLKYELGVIKDMGFAEYFLVVDELVRWSKANNILVGPGRGSVGGSLIAFLMGITDVDPIRFGLLFERFINPSRRDLPDIDLDFMSSRRQEVIKHLVDKYGASRVAGISNYTVLGSASGLKDVGRVYDLDVNNMAASKFIPKVHGQPVDLDTARKSVAEIARFADDHPDVWRNATALQGVLRSYGRHASGIIAAGTNISNLAVVEQRSGDSTINWDMRMAEDMGLVKLDVLGLSTLDVIGRTLQFIRQRHSSVPDISQIPLDDPATLKAFSKGRTIGVFQFEGGAARRILKDMSKVNPVTFDDIVAANALNRPGPIDAGLVDKYVDAKNGEVENELAHPNMAGALAETYNVIVYQEQVMRVAVDLAGFSLADADKLRKAMGKKLASEMAKQKDQFVNGCVSFSGMDETAARELFDQIEVFAGYAFNKSHAAEYSLISYQCMWLKVHYPVEFYAACLSTVDEDKLKPVVEDALKAGVEILPPDINQSELDFVIANDATLITPFNRVKNCSEKSAEAIMAIRADGKITSRDDLKKRLTAKKLGRYCNARVIEHLDAVGAFARVEPGQLSPIDESRIKDQLTLMPGLVTRIPRLDRNLPGDKLTRARHAAIVTSCEAVDPDIVHVEAYYPKAPAFMVVSDAPTTSEEAEKMFSKGRSFEYLNEALMMNKLSRHSAYWTGLLKKIKDDKIISPAEINTYAPFLAQEIDLLKPPLIVTLGSAAARYFIPDLKGSIMDHVGKTVFLKNLDATLVIGFNPAMIHFEPSRMDDLARVFAVAKEIIDKT
jgi:DNA polymerase-3 subunit alpha